MDRLKSKMGRLKSKMGENVEQKRKAKLVEKSKFYQCLVKSQSRFFFYSAAGLLSHICTAKEGICMCECIMRVYSLAANLPVILYIAAKIIRL